MGQFKLKPILGSLPEGGATDWWTDEQWDEHRKYVEQLKAEGKYLTEGEEITINYAENNFFKNDNPLEEPFRNFGFLIPSKGDIKIGDDK